MASFSEAPKANSTQAVSGPELISVADASSWQCSNGGKVYSLYMDLNSNGSQDAGEAFMSLQVVCNGQDGIADPAAPVAADGVF